MTLRAKENSLTKVIVENSERMKVKEYFLFFWYLVCKNGLPKDALPMVGVDLKTFNKIDDVFVHASQKEVERFIPTAIGWLTEQLAFLELKNLDHYVDMILIRIKTKFPQKLSELFELLPSLDEIELAISNLIGYFTPEPQH